MQYLDGNSFEGEWIEGKADGFSIFKHKGGGIYEGFWINDMQNGNNI